MYSLLAKCTQRGYPSNVRTRSTFAVYSPLNYASNSMTGKIKRLASDKGFGFITPDGSDKDVFFHNTALVGVSFNDLREGDAVTFETEDSEKGPRAKDVKRV